VARQAWAQGGGAPTTPQKINRSASAQHTPLRCTDPTGHWIERAVDIACIADDIWDIPQNGLTWDNGLALAADVGGLLLPGMTGGGLLVRAAFHADDAARLITHADDVIKLLNATDNTTDTLNRVDDAIDVVRVLENTHDLPQRIFRSASGSPDSLTPRPGIDDLPDGGLSFWDSIDYIKPGDKYVEVDTGRLRNLQVVPDNIPPGHVTVRPPTLNDLRAWAASRGTGRVHPYTQEILDAVVYRGKK
jgi:hypothetical protein